MGGTPDISPAAGLLALAGAAMAMRRRHYTGTCQRSENCECVNELSDGVSLSADHT